MDITIYVIIISLALMGYKRSVVNMGYNMVNYS